MRPNVPGDSAQRAAIAEYAYIQARNDFYAFRQHMHPRMLLASWQANVALHLQRFHEQLLAGTRPKLILQTPPQHGKTEQVRDFIAWLAGKNPDWRMIYASYSDPLGIKTNMAIQRMIMSRAYQQVFPNTRLSDDNVVTLAGRFLRNSSMLEFVGREGSFRNTTVNGPINGEGLDIGIIDDPIKGRKEANSTTIRESTWDWLTDDFFGRFSDHAGMIMILTRWHLDDPAGRWIARFPETQVLRYPAIATEDEEHLLRVKGEALFPELKPLDFLNERKCVLSQASFEAQYQQNPIIVGGGMFPIAEIEVIEYVPISRVLKSVRYYDKAGTEGGGSFTAGVLMHKLNDGKFVVEDVRHGQWGAFERETRIKQTAQSDAVKYPHHFIYVEQEPGSGGKESAENSIRMLAGYKAYADKVSGQGDKTYRAEPLSAQVQGGNLAVVAADWNIDFFNELEAFPNGKYKDQVDASSGAFNKLVLESTYDSSLSWVGDFGNGR